MEASLMSRGNDLLGGAGPLFAGFTMPFKLKEYAYCRVCHEAVPPDELVNGMCRRCAEGARRARGGNPLSRKL